MQSHPFVTACATHDLDIVEELIPAMSAKRLKEGFIHACRSGHADVVDITADQMCRLNIEIPWEHGLINACYHGHISLMYMLAARCPSIDASKILRSTPINASVDTLKFLIARGAQVQDLTYRFHRLINCFEFDIIPRIHLLLEAGVDGYAQLISSYVIRLMRHGMSHEVLQARCPQCPEVFEQYRAWRALRHDAIAAAVPCLYTPLISVILDYVGYS
jgi:hypothetical protein